MTTDSRAARPRKMSIRPDWISKTLAGGLAGLSLSIALLGLVAWLGPDGTSAPDKTQVIMWLIPPLWMTIFSLTYLFRSGLRAWLWLGSANLLAYSALSLVQHLSRNS